MPKNAHIVVKHQVNAPFKQVWATFSDRTKASKLFAALSPPFPKAKLHSFGGTEVGALVKLDLEFGFMSQPWESVVTEQVIKPNEAWFIDEGKVMPLGLIYFSHRHYIKSIDPNTTEITEDITLLASTWLMTLVNQLGFWSQMSARGGVYKKYPWS
jgi:ligand-binding SRPBCC domain-containing protein